MRTIFIIIFSIIYFIVYSQNQKINFKINDSIITINPIIKKINVIKYLSHCIFKDNIKIHLIVEKENDFPQVLYYVDKYTYPALCIKIDTGLICNTKSLSVLENFNFFSDLHNIQNVKSNGLRFIIEDENGNFIPDEGFHLKGMSSGTKSQNKNRKAREKDKKKSNRLINKGNLTKYVKKKVICSNSEVIVLRLLLSRSDKFLSSKDFNGYNLQKGIYFITLYYWVILDDQINGPDYIKRKYTYTYDYEPINIVKKDIEENHYTNEQVFQGFVKSNRVKLIVK